MTLRQWSATRATGGGPGLQWKITSLHSRRAGDIDSLVTEDLVKKGFGSLFFVKEMGMGGRGWGFQLYLEMDFKYLFSNVKLFFRSQNTHFFSKKFVIFFKFLQDLKIYLVQVSK